MHEDGHGHGEKAPPSKITEEEKLGLTTEQVNQLRGKWGYNELPEIKISMWWVLFLQFTGTMPYMLEIALIICLICSDYPDFAIILIMLLCNGFLGFHEQMKAADSLVRRFDFQIICKIYEKKTGISLLIYIPIIPLPLSLFRLG